AGTIPLTISRSVAEGVHEDLDLVNYNRNPIRFNLEIAMRSDFADLFEVKSHRFVRRGRIETQWDPDARELRTSYSNLDFNRALVYRVSSDSRPDYANGRITFPIELQPGASWHTCCDYVLGRDSLIVSLQNMIVNTGLARGALKKLGQFQAQA